MQGASGFRHEDETFLQECLDKLRLEQIHMGGSSTLMCLHSNHLMLACKFHVFKDVKL